MELSPQCYTLDNVCGYVTTTDIKLMTKQLMKKQFQNFSGADLVMMDVKPEVRFLSSVFLKGKHQISCKKEANQIL